ncbi:MAG: TRAP transporter small permease [Gammaproteobacteria bacterium]|nr:TRAP transporter small permease [Gammaproteobacteria bacterium]MBU1466105.1 TRAP transporter small permease [Gammaproteobacteria bacterium]MBU2021900.1 TRAP transporter small permease [Gammaproteobacteria bacterium]MBU2239533.1 TRAP transporter small permease [Gammaproteobacteria bacterium]MBU2318839.1 TRAP transporter small permease [Gammaproteobacteria bacterium]
MNNIINKFERFIEYMMALALAVMFSAIFINVVLRYLFGSGIAASEELSRLLFVWLIFMGATLAVGRNSHIGFDLVQRKLPKNLRLICVIISHSLMLYALYLFLEGSWKQYNIGWNINSTVMKYPLAFMYSTGLFASIGMGFYIIRNLILIILKSENSHIPGNTKISPEQLKENN